MVNAQMIISLLTDLAPQNYAYNWDNVGIQAGSLNQKTENVLVSLDINKEVLNEAKDKNCNLIISHHPVIFDELKSIHDQTATGRIIIDSIKNDITLYSAHTNLDVAQGGLNDYLADLLDINNLEGLSLKERKNYYKLVIFGPEKSLEKIRDKVLATDAGQIGNYSKTSFVTKGEGTFQPEKNSNPYLGKEGKMARVNEFRFETIVKEENLNNIINLVKKVHPYEEVAYDIYPLENNFSDMNISLGRIGQLKRNYNLIDYIKKVKEKLNLPYLRYYGNDDSEIKKVALCSGSGADFISKAKYNGADLYITGDVKYHEAQHAEQLGLNLIDAGHYGTEKVVKNLLFSYLSKKVSQKNYKVNIIKSELNTNPWKYI